MCTHEWRKSHFLILIFLSVISSDQFRQPISGPPPSFPEGWLRKLPYFLCHFSRTEGSEILSCSKANKSACQSFMDAGRRHEAPESETKDSVTYCNDDSQNTIIYTASLSPRDVKIFR